MSHTGIAEIVWFSGRNPAARGASESESSAYRSKHAARPHGVVQGMTQEIAQQAEWGHTALIDGRFLQVARHFLVMPPFGELTPVEMRLEPVAVRGRGGRQRRELDPIAYLWGNVKGNDLANFSPKELWEFSKAAREALIRKRRRFPQLIRAFWLQTELDPTGAA